MQLNIDNKLAEKLETFRKTTPYNSIDELAAFILEDFLTAQESAPDSEENPELTERLRNLGYM